MAPKAHGVLQVCVRVCVCVSMCVSHRHATACINHTEETQSHVASSAVCMMGTVRTRPA